MELLKKQIKRAINLDATNCDEYLSLMDFYLQQGMSFDQFQEILDEVLYG